MIKCRICNTALGTVDYASSAPGLTSLSTRIDVPTEVFVCRDCGHAQSPDLPDVQAFYDHDYRISLQSDAHDQLYAIEAGQEIFRTEHQAKLVSQLDIPKGARILDFGAAKALTLRRVLQMRPDLQPYVFDVSEDYRAYWETWLSADAQATYVLPEEWVGKFDLITAHFVLEHVADPKTVLQSLVRCLAPAGRLFFTVPDPIANSGDLLVVDHLNHFVPSSIQRLLGQVGMRTISVRHDIFRGAHVVLAEAGQQTDTASPDIDETLNLLRDWQAILSSLKTQVQDAGNGPVAIYGAGFYGALFGGLLMDRAVCFLDQNPHLQGGTVVGLPVFAPMDCPMVTTVVAALNPARARDILPPDASWLPNGAQVIYPKLTPRRGTLA